MKPSEYYKIEEIIKKLANNLENLRIDFQEEGYHHWSRMGGILKMLEKDAERLPKAIRNAAKTVEKKRLKKARMGSKAG
ncbi:MAG: hypothetical protein NTX61_08305 [Bacteroidetes bacterium]|nr:hypothetical protein [Bacteroidota bacterium]